MEQVCAALDGQRTFLELAETLKPAESEDMKKSMSRLLEEVQNQANLCLADGSQVATLDSIGSAAYDIHLENSDRDYVLRLRRNDTEYRILQKDWETFAKQLNEFFGLSSVLDKSCIPRYVFHLQMGSNGIKLGWWTKSLI